MGREISPLRLTATGAIIIFEKHKMHIAFTHSIISML